MQINSVNNVSFGLVFSSDMNKMIQEGNQYIEKRNSRSTQFQQRDLTEISGLFNDSFTLDVTKSQSGSKTITLTSPKIDKYPIFTLLKGEILDRPYTVLIKNKLKDLAKFKS